MSAEPEAPPPAIAREDLIALLKDALTVRVSCGGGPGCYDPGRVEVEILFDGEVICSDGDSIALPGRD